VELYAAGFTETELGEVCKAVVSTPWWSEGGSSKSLGALTVEVARRALTPPGAADHAQRKATEVPAQPYHALAKPRRDDGPVASPQEAKVAIAAALEAMK